MKYSTSTTNATLVITRMIMSTVIGGGGGGSTEAVDLQDADSMIGYILFADSPNSGQW